MCAWGQNGSKKQNPKNGVDFPSAIWNPAIKLVYSVQHSMPSDAIPSASPPSVKISVDNNVTIFPFS